MTHRPESTDNYIEVDGLRLHYMAWGNREAQPMVLLHGLQDCARSWDLFALPMSSDYHVLVLDHRGHGDSEWADAVRYGLADYVTDVEALVGQLGLRRMVLVGHSAGGRNALVYTVRHPERVAGLVVADIDLDAVNPESNAMLRRYLSEADDWESLEAVVERLRSRQPDSNSEMLAHQALHMTKETPGGGRVWKRDSKLLRAYERPDLWAEWSQIACPTLVVRGRQSRLLTHEVAVKMRESIGRVRLAELDGGGHWFYQEAPGAFEATVRWFLEEPPR